MKYLVSDNRTGCRENMALMRKVKTIFTGLVLILFIHLIVFSFFSPNSKHIQLNDEDLESSLFHSTHMDMSKGLDTYRSKDIKTPLLLLFTTFKETSLRSSINNNTIEYWSLLRPWVQPLLFVENNYPNNSLAKHAKERGWLVYRAPTLRKGIPILRDMFLRAEQLVKPTTNYRYWCRIRNPAIFRGGGYHARQ